MSLTVAAMLYADLRHDLLGAASTLAAELGGQTVLTRTVERLARVEGLDAIVVGAPPEQLQDVAALLAELPVQLVPCERPETPARRGMRAARAFGRYGWRGGIAGTTFFDELFHVPLLAAAIERTGAEALLLTAAGAALLEVHWTGELVRFHREHAQRYRFTFNQAPPGLGGCVLDAAAAVELARNGLYPGRLLAYDPHAPGLDPISQPYNRPLPQEVVATDRRFLADSPRGLWLCRRLVELAGPDADGETLCRAAATLGAEPWPRELTVELTGERPVQDALRAPAARGHLPLPALRDALAGLEEPGDVNVMLAGAGDALLHPDWPAVVELARAVGPVGLATWGMDLPAHADALLSAGVDVLQIYVDAVSDSTYALHKRGGSAQQVWANIEQFLRLRDQEGRATPLVVPTMVKTTAALAEQDEFFRRCMDLTGWGVILEPAGGAGVEPVVRMAPPTRTPCRRLAGRLTLRADGRLAVCEQDHDAALALDGPGVLAAWRGPALAALRQAHAQGRWGDVGPCAQCEEFHRS